MSKRADESSKARLERAKNIARGALSALKDDLVITGRKGASAPIKFTPAWKTRQISTSRLSKAIEEARHKLNASEQIEFNDWLTKITRVLDPSARSVGTHLAALGIFPKDVFAPTLDAELKSATSKVLELQKVLIEFCAAAKLVANDFSLHKYESALVHLQNASNTFGYSFWHIETELALTRLIQGVEGLKKRVESLSADGAGWQKFIFYYFGVRNEPAQNASRFRVMIRKTLDDFVLRDPLNVYLKHRLYGALEHSEAKLANVLALEQTTSVIDLFFTLQRISQIILSQPSQFSKAVIELAFNAQQALAAPLRQLSEKDEKETGAALAIAAIDVLFGRSSLQEAKTTDQQAILAVASQLSTSGNQLQSDEMSKIIVNMRWLPVAQAIGEIHDIPALPELAQGGHLLPSPFAMTLRDAIHTAELSSFQPGAKSALLSLRKIEELTEKGHVNDAVQLVSSSISSSDDPNLVDALQVILARQLIAAGEDEGAVRVCATAGCSNERLMSFLPLSELFVGKRWKTLRSLGPSIHLAIALSHASRTIEDSKLKTFKRYAVEDLLVSVSAMSIDELIPKLATTSDPYELAYFGYVICDISTIELLPAMTDSRVVRNARVSLLRNLANLPGPRATQFENEAKALEDALQVDDGLSVLDDSKVHVDEMAVIDFVFAEYQADFLRYKKLIQERPDEGDFLPDLLKNFDTQSVKLFQMPKSDADDLLVQLINNVLQRFLYDPASGLDIIIGRRIRHNTISSELRGVLEKEDLIGTIHHGKYQTPVRVSKASSTLDGNKRKIVSAASVRFSESIDQLVGLLRDQYFNVRSKAKPRGAFEITINSIIYAWIKTSTKTCNSLDEFSQECIQAFWLFLSNRLDVLRPMIESEIKKTLKSSFQRFASELVVQGADVSLQSAVQRAAEELQRRATVIASWISIPKVRLTAHNFTVTKTIDIALAVVIGESSGFKPIIEKQVDPSIELNTRNFVIVNDALYVALFNISKHSGKKMNNQITISAKLDSNELCFDITNEIAPSARKPEKQNRLAAIRRDIQKRMIADGARKNKHSGFYKLAALVSSEKENALEFDFLGKDKFSLRFRLSL